MASNSRNHFQAFEDASVPEPVAGLRDESAASGPDGSATGFVAWYCTPVPSACEVSNLKLREKYSSNPVSRFVVHQHDATTLHFDLRLEVGGVFRSWAVPKGPSLDPAVRRLAVPVEDHDLSAGDFEGVHAGPHRRGTGAVIIWDEGAADIVRIAPAHLFFHLFGHKLAGGFALTETGPRRWILVKAIDADAVPGSDIVADQPGSTRTGRTWQQVAAEAGGSS
jgi:DNA ligase D-like protein (predicted 3'-phosphoesterase)